MRKRDDGRETIDYSVETSTRILSAAETLIRRDGVRSISFERIAELAGLTRGAIYYNFKGRDELFLRLLERLMDRRVSVLTQVFDNISAKQRVDVVAAGLALDVMEWRNWTPLFVATWLDATESEPLMQRLKSLRERFYGQIAELLSQAFPEASSKATSDFSALLIGSATGLSIEASFNTVTSGQLEAFLLTSLEQQFCKNLH